MSEKKVLSAKKYLQQLQDIDVMIDQDIETLEAMKEDAYSTGGIDYSKERVQTSCAGDSIGNAVARYTSKNDEINAEIDQFVDAKNKIIGEIRGLHVAPYIQILYKVYVQYKSIRTAAKEMNKSYKYALDAHKAALAAFEQKYKNRYYLT